MKLASVELDGYRRFATRQCLRLDGRIVALLGPNEAGKTSILRALQTIGSDEAYRAIGASQDITRNRDLPGNHVVLTAKFQLDASDLDALSGIEEAASAQWLIVKKVVTGQRTFTIAPAVKRSAEHRNELIAILEDILRSSGAHETSEIRSRLS